jgi:tetratricopeptide (TPR) repeat protein
MSPNERELLFRRARHALGQRSLAEAAERFQTLVYEDGADARVLSYHGLVTGLFERRVSDAVAICRRAIALDPHEPETYLNLARLYCAADQPASAVSTLRAAVRAGVRTRAVTCELDRLSPRRRPPLPMLHRDHVLNRLLGQLRARLARAGDGGAALARHVLERAVGRGFTRADAVRDPDRA